MRRIHRNLPGRTRIGGAHASISYYYEEEEKQVSVVVELTAAEEWYTIARGSQLFFSGQDLGSRAETRIITIENTNA